MTNLKIVSDSHLSRSFLLQSFSGSFETVLISENDCFPCDSDMTAESLVLWEVGDADACREKLRQFSSRGIRLNPIVLVLRSVDQIAVLREFVGDVSAILLPDTTPQAMIDIFAAIRQGVCVYPPDLIRRAPAAECSTGLSNGTGDRLTNREAVILDHLKMGLCNKLIAAKLGISGSTVRVHIRSIFRKLGVSNRTQAALWALETRSAA